MWGYSTAARDTKAWEKRIEGELEDPVERSKSDDSSKGIKWESIRPTPRSENLVGLASNRKEYSGSKAITVLREQLGTGNLTDPLPVAGVSKHTVVKATGQPNNGLYFRQRIETVSYEKQMPLQLYFALVSDTVMYQVLMWDSNPQPSLPVRPGKRVTCALRLEG